jgi:hypothetical protein
MRRYVARVDVSSTLHQQDGLIAVTGIETEFSGISQRLQVTAPYRLPPGLDHMVVRPVGGQISLVNRNCGKQVLEPLRIIAVSIN